MTFAIPLPGSPVGISIPLGDGLRPSLPRPPGRVPGIPGSSLQWLTPAAACTLLGTNCFNPFSNKKPWEGQPGTQTVRYLARCEFKGVRRRVSTGAIIQRTESHTVLTVFGPVKSLTTINQPFHSFSDAVFFETVGTDFNGDEFVSTSLLLMTSVIADTQWSITEVNISLKRADQDDDPPLRPTLVGADGLPTPIPVPSGLSTPLPTEFPLEVDGVTRIWKN